MTTIDLEKRYAASYILDEILYKVASVSPLSKISRKEKKLSDYLYNSWKNKTSLVAKIVKNMAIKKKKSNEIIKEIDKQLGNWHKTTHKILSQHVKDVYMLGRKIGFKKATGQIKYPLKYGLPKLDFKITKAVEINPAFDLLDEKAIQSLENRQLYWIGEYYEANVSSMIAEIVKETMLEYGDDVTTAGKLLEEKIKGIGEFITTPKGFSGTTRQYFDALSANVTTSARVFSQLRSFEDAGVTKYTISNPGGARTCSRCALIDGKEFLVSDGVKQMNQILDAKNPSDIKTIQPWLSEKEFIKLGERYDKIGTKAYTDSNIALPPFHFKCRCTVDISPVSMVF